MDDVSNARETTSKLPRVETGDIFQQIAVHQKWSFKPKVGRKLSRKCCNISDSVFFFSSKSLRIWGKKKRKEAGAVLQTLAQRAGNTPSPALVRTVNWLSNSQPLLALPCCKETVVLNALLKWTSKKFLSYLVYTGIHIQQNSLVCTAGRGGFLSLVIFSVYK